MIIGTGEPNPLLSRAFFGRTWHLATALIGAVGLVLQVVALVTGPKYAANPAHAWWNFGSFFTIESNVLVLCVSLTLAADSLRRGGPVWAVLRQMSLVNITVTMIIQFFLLRDLPEITSLTGPGLYADRILHYVVPVMVIAGYLVFGPRPVFTWRSTFLVLVFPAAWCVYTVLRGAATGWYPYPFIDVARLGPAVILNCAGVGAVLLVMAAAYYLADRALPGAPERQPDRQPEETRA